MGRRTGGGARVVPNSVPATSSSSNSAVVFTPLVPIDHVADDRESGTAAALDLFSPSSARYREDGKEYVSLHPSRMRLSLKSGSLLFPAQHGRGIRGQFFTQTRAAGSGATKRACGGESGEAS